ncbi:hypothetical protein [Lentzea kentuckyensis]|uniref:hypothetical protein n=1 Tax=Lentzea kentuckyensis TaxID=360086 RepID=UPI000A3C2BEA|nr:hypothetical protein [Lentzea kentuckyensis]
MSEEDQSTGNDVDGVVNGPSIQAGSIGDVYVNAPGKLPRGKVFWCLTVSVAVVGLSALAVTLFWPHESAKQTPVAAAVATTAESGTTPPVASNSPTTSAAARAARPAPVGTAPRPPVGAPTTVPPVPTTTFDTAAAPPPATGAGVRFSGTLPFGSYNLDFQEPRGKDGHNVWPLTPGRLHGDPGHWLAEWLSDGVPGRAECVAHLAKEATSDAENLVTGSRVCGSTPEGRIFLIEVATVDPAGITGQVTVWELTNS